MTRNLNIALLFQFLIIKSLTTSSAFLFQKTLRTSTKRFASNANELFPMRPGSSVALVTPMDNNGKIDEAALRALLQFHVAAGTSNLCILGTTGEASVLSDDERTRVLTIAVEEVKGKMPILAGTGTINPATVKRHTLQAMDLGCDAALIVTPYYVKPPQRALLQHFTTMADLGLPVVLYNVPGRTSIDLQDETIALCAQHENIVAVKDATGKLERLESLKQLVPKEFLLYSGDDGTSKDFILQGGHGCISVTANVAPSIMQQMVDAALAGDAARATELDDRINVLHKILFCEANPIPVKYAVYRMGKSPSAFCRPPLCSLDPAKESVVDDALRQAGIIE